MTDLKDEIEEILHPEKKKLHPPMAPKTHSIKEFRGYLDELDEWHDKSVAGEKDLEGNSCGSQSVSERTLTMPSITLSGDDSKLAIDFSNLTNNSSFQRAIIEFIKKFIPGFEDVNPRASKQVMTKKFNQNYVNYKNVMKELKEVLEARKKKKE